MNMPPKPSPTTATSPSKISKPSYKTSPHPSSSPSPKPTPEKPCEYTPCQTGPNKDPRKVISHIFGRNKTVTKLVPSHVWVHYCRQHYQRARYRTKDWPIKQCELLLVSLRRMEAWGGIRGFRVLLRRREGARIRAGKAGVGCGDISMDSHSSGSARGGNGPTEGPRRVTRSSTRGKSATTAIADSISEVTSPRTSQNSPSSPTLTPTPSPAGTTRSRAKLRKRPTIASSPVPAWLRADTDPSAIRTFAEVRAIVNRVKADFEELRDRKLSTSAGEGKAVMPKFPDIEILPVFYEGIFVEQQRGRGRARV